VRGPTTFADWEVQASLSYAKLGHVSSSSPTSADREQGLLAKETSLKVQPLASGEVKTNVNPTLAAY
jgi:hypothetical protein